MDSLEPFRKANLVAALILATIEVVVVATTFLPGGPHVPTSVVGAMFVMAFPVFGAALLRDVTALNDYRQDQSAKRSRRTPAGLKRLLAEVPKKASVGFRVFFFAMWLAALSSFVTGPSGQPTERDGRYFLNNHGEFTEVSEDEFQHAQSRSNRGFAAVPASFFAAAALLSAYGPLMREQPDSLGPVLPG